MSIFSGVDIESDPKYQFYENSAGSLPEWLVYVMYVCVILGYAKYTNYRLQCIKHEVYVCKMYA